MATFGEELRRFRKEKNITQSALAAAIGTDFTYISKIENDRVILPTPCAVAQQACSLRRGIFAAFR